MSALALARLCSTVCARGIKYLPTDWNFYSPNTFWFSFEIEIFGSSTFSRALCVCFCVNRCISWQSTKYTQSKLEAFHTKGVIRSFCLISFIYCDNFHCLNLSLCAFVPLCANFPASDLFNEAVIILFSLFY